MYATRADLERRFSQSEISNLASMQSSAMAVDDALQDASEEIDSYLHGIYTLPLPNTPNNLSRICCDIARYRLYFQQPTEEVTKRYDDAVKFLQRVQDGKATLAILDENNDVTDTVAPRNAASIPLAASFTTGVFGDDVLSKMPSVK